MEIMRFFLFNINFLRRTIIFNSREIRISHVGLQLKIKIWSGIIYRHFLRYIVLIIYYRMVIDCLATPA